MGETDKSPEEQEEIKETTKTFTQSEKARKGHLFAVVFLGVIVLMVLFLSFFPINESNRDILVGIIGVFTGNISAMIAIAAGRDPAEIEEIKEKLAVANADRQALISRLRDSQIQLQILRDQITDLQTAMIRELSIFSGKEIGNKKSAEDVELNKDVKDWLDK